MINQIMNKRRRQDALNFSFAALDLLGAAWLPPPEPATAVCNDDDEVFERPRPPLFTDAELRDATPEMWRLLKLERGWQSLPDNERKGIAAKRRRLNGNAGVERRRLERKHKMEQLQLDNKALRRRQRDLLARIALLEDTNAELRACKQNRG